MADYTFSSNATQEAILTWVTGLENIERAKKDPPLPPLTNEEYLLQRLTDIFKGWKKRYLEINEINPIVNIWDDLTQAQRDQIKTIAGI